MKLRFSHLPIKGKLMLVSMLPLVVVLVLACVMFVSYDIVTFRDAMERDLAANARLIASTTRAALVYSDPEAVTERLQALAAKPRITAAALYNRESTLYAWYVRPGAEPQFPGRAEDLPGKVTSNRMSVVEPVILNRRRIGTIYVESDLDELHARIRVYVTGSVVSMLLFLAIASVLTLRLQRFISKPILDLAGVAKLVSEKKDYSVRAQRQSEDEIGMLTEAFNLMLLQIQRQDAALRESEERIRFANEASSVGAWEWDIDANRMTWSDNVPAMYGLAPGDSRKSFEGFVECVHPEDRELVKDVTERAISENSLCEIEYRTVRPDGTVRWLSTRGRLFRQSPATRGRMMGVVMDITDRKQSQEALRIAHERLKESVKSLEAFCYSIAHDLRAPLRAMQGLTTALLEDYGDRLDETGHEYARRITAAALRMDRLIQDLLAYGRLTSAELPLTTLELDQVISGLISQFTLEIEAKQATVEVRRPLPQVRANQTMLEQVLANLLSNALKFVAHDDRPQIRIWAEERRHSVLLFIRDNGIGIDPEHHERIFRVFERLPGPMPYPGTGIGLAIVQKGIERMGGRVGVESKPGDGSCFWIELPKHPRAGFGDRLAA